MKKNSLFLSVLLGLTSSLSVQAQTSTLTVLIDSLPYAGFDIIESFNNKLYTLPSYRGGMVNEINTTTGALTHVATLPALSGSYEYTTYSGNFVFIKGKTVAAMNNSAGKTTYHIAAGLSKVDTLLVDNMAFSRIINVDTMVYINSTPKGLSSPRFYATDLINPIVLLDSNVYRYRQSPNQKRMYYIASDDTYSDEQIKSTNGTSKITVATLIGVTGSKGFEFVGEVASDMYFVTYQRGSIMDTTWIKKCNSAGVVTLVDTIIRKSSYPRNGGFVMNANKLIIPFYNRVIVYDLTTKTKEDIIIGARTSHWPQDNVAKNHFYLNIPSSLDSTYISDGTAAGTFAYKTALGEDFGTRFENYEGYQSLGNKAIICDEYPIANRDDELYIGNATNAVLYKLYPSRKSYPSHFEQVDGSIFFTIHDASYKKMTLMKLEGCDIPMTNPLGIKETLKNNTIICSIFPNPSNGIFNIETKAELESVEVYNILGAKVYFNSQKSTLTEIDLSSQVSGIYFIKMMDKNGAISLQKMQLIK